MTRWERTSVAGPVRAAGLHRGACRWQLFLVATTSGGYDNNAISNTIAASTFRTRSRSALSLQFPRQPLGLCLADKQTDDFRVLSQPRAFKNCLQLQITTHQNMTHFHEECNHQGLENRLIRDRPTVAGNHGSIHRQTRLGGMLSYYHPIAA